MSDCSSDCFSVRRTLLTLAAAIALVVMAAGLSPALAAFNCSAAPMNGCLLPTPPHPAGLWMNIRNHRRDNVVWKWWRGRESQTLSFADPTTTNDYAFCLYTSNGNQTDLVFHGLIPAASDCRNGPCWRATGTGFRYRTGQALPDGLTKLYLDARPEGRGRIVLKGRGQHLALPDLPIALPLRVQLQSEDGQCWESDYAPSTVTENSNTHFRGHAN